MPPSNEHPFAEKLNLIADEMAIGLFQRFSFQEALLFLRCNTSSLRKLVKNKSISCLQLTDDNIEFFGYQLLEYLLGSISGGEAPTPKKSGLDKIIRVDDVIEMTGVSRGTLWRWERQNKFVKRVQLGANSVGWRLSEVNDWIKSR